MTFLCGKTVLASCGLDWNTNYRLFINDDMRWYERDKKKNDGLNLENKL